MYSLFKSPADKIKLRLPDGVEAIESHALAQFSAYGPEKDYMVGIVLSEWACCAHKAGEVVLDNQDRQYIEKIRWKCFDALNEAVIEQVYRTIHQLMDWQLIHRYQPRDQ